jgi:GT2 family glycosyltransferase
VGTLGETGSSSLDRGVLALVDGLEAALGRGLDDDRPGPFYGQDASGDTDGYEIWVERHQPDVASLQARISALLEKPVFSIVIPVYKPDLAFFWRCVESVLGQIYPHWELCLCDDGSNDPRLDELLGRLPGLDPRIRVTKLAQNGGISAATNGAIAMSTGDVLAFMDHDDELTPDALAEVAIAMNEDPAADIVYSDEDKIDEDDHRYAPFFKPDWSPDYLLSCMYTGHLTVIRRALVEEVGGLRTEFDGSQDHDLMLRATEKANRIVHLPKILYHWRAIDGSAASSSDAKPWAHQAGYAAVADALARRGEVAEVLPGAFAGARRVKRSIAVEPHVTVVIPFRDGGSLLYRCLQSLERTAGYDAWDAVLVDNGSWEPETLALVSSLEGNERYTITRDPAPFNWARINNDASRQARGEILLFLNNDIEGRTDGWMRAMVEHVQRPEVGAVGSRLLYPDGTIQHAGLVIGMGGIAGHAFRFAPHWYPGYFGVAKVIRNVSAVTGACMMVRKDVFDAVGGFDTQLAVAYNDVDFCLRLRDRGYLVVYTPYAELVHYESATRGWGSDGGEDLMMLDRWRKLYEEGDPYFNPNLSLRHSEFRLAGPDEEPPWKRILNKATA